VLDKALYKPGETVQVRALALATDLLPIAAAQVCALPAAATRPAARASRPHVGR
jgi:hypothetical protein